MPRIAERHQIDAAGTVAVADLPALLPYGLNPTHFRRMAEDVQELLHRVNTTLLDAYYPPLERLLDKAGFSGMISKFIAERLAGAAPSLAVNNYHNGYPDLLVAGQYPDNAVQKGEGGLEVKASRSDVSWQAHGQRHGWFCVVQFSLDERRGVALWDREPTRIVAVMVAQVEVDDWSWQPAKEGKIRSGTASIKPSGRAKCRAGAVWVAPDYRATHDALLVVARRDAFSSQADTLVEQELRGAGGHLSLEEVLRRLQPLSPYDEPRKLRERVRRSLRKLEGKDLVALNAGVWRLTDVAEAQAEARYRVAEAREAESMAANVDKE